MNIEIANRLLQYRKKNNLSQEELAEKLGISRQAVSKWERAEASPDTDNLINLAKLYGVSLDELINSDPNTKDVKNEQADDTKTVTDESDSENSDEIGKKSNTKVTIGTDGIHVRDNDETVHINFKGIHVRDGDESVHIGLNGIHIEDNASNEHTHHIYLRPKWADLPVSIITVIAYLLIGSIWGLWHPGWIVFLMIPIGHGIINAIVKRRLKAIPYPVIVTAIFLLIGFAFKMWHPGWVIFLTIPVFYWLVD
jgi:transcriptional regulator with XRE-family HTH domain